MSFLGPQGVNDRMAEIARRLDSLSPRAPSSAQSFAQTLGSATRQATCADGVLDPSALGTSTITGEIGGTSSDLRAMADQAADKYGIDRSLFHALVNQESSWNPRATSSVGAKGLCQLMDGTAKGLGVTDSYDPQQSLEGGARYLRQMLDANRGDTRRALASYNAGFGRVNGRDPGEWPHETQNYVKRILAKAEGVA